MDPVFLYVNVSRHVERLNALTSPLPVESQSTSPDVHDEVVGLAQLMPYLRRALSCNLCNGVLADPVLVLECFHWSCATCGSPSQPALLASASDSGQRLDTTGESASVCSPTSSSPTTNQQAAHKANSSASVIGRGKPPGSLGSGSASASISGRRRSSRAGDLTSYTRRCRWCEQKITKSHVAMMDLVCTAYRTLCRMLHQHRRLFEATKAAEPIVTTPVGALGVIDRKTRGSDAKGDVYFLGKLVAECQVGATRHIEWEELPGGTPPDNLFSGEYLRLKANCKANDPILKDITGILSMYRNPRSPLKPQTDEKVLSAHQPVQTLKWQASQPSDATNATHTGPVLSVAQIPGLSSTEQSTPTVDEQAVLVQANRSRKRKGTGSRSTATLDDVTTTGGENEPSNSATPSTPGVNGPKSKRRRLQDPSLGRATPELEQHKSPESTASPRRLRRRSSRHSTGSMISAVRLTDHLAGLVTSTCSLGADNRGPLLMGTSAHASDGSGETAGDAPASPEGSAISSSSGCSSNSSRSSSNSSDNVAIPTSTTDGADSRSCRKPVRMRTRSTSRW